MNVWRGVSHTLTNTIKLRQRILWLVLLVEQLLIVKQKMLNPDDLKSGDIVKSTSIYDVNHVDLYEIIRKGNEISVHLVKTSRADLVHYLGTVYCEVRLHNITDMHWLRRATKISQ